MTTKFPVKPRYGKSMYYCPPRTILDVGVAKHFPECYKSFFKEWKNKEKKAPVHYIPNEDKYEIYVDGTIQKVKPEPIPTVEVPQMHKGIWGGDAVVQGFKKKHPKKDIVPNFWLPKLYNGVVYSEVLNKHMRTVVTVRAIDEINKNFGFDYYLLNTKAYDLVTELSLKLKRRILHDLYYKTLYPDDEEKREQVYNKYKHYLNDYTEADIEWYGLTIPEASVKMKKILEEQTSASIVPLKQKYRKELIEQLKTMSKEELGDPTEERRSWWRRTIFPF